jgi:hypothetical protein
MPFMSKRDIADMGFAVKNNMDLIAASFTRSVSQILFDLYFTRHFIFLVGFLKL